MPKDVYIFVLLKSICCRHRPLRRLYGQPYITKLGSQSLLFSQVCSCFWVREIVLFMLTIIFTLRMCVFAAKKLDQFPGFSIRLIPSATSLFSVAKLSISRNNVRSVTAGIKNVELFLDKYIEASLY